MQDQTDDLCRPLSQKEAHYSDFPLTASTRTEKEYPTVEKGLVLVSVRDMFYDSEKWSWDPNERYRRFGINSCSVALDKSGAIQSFPFSLVMATLYLVLAYVSLAQPRWYRLRCPAPLWPYYIMNSLFICVGAALYSR